MHLRRVEDKIRGLCKELVVERDDEPVRAMVTELRAALSRYFIQVHAKARSYPVAVERRHSLSSQPGIALPGKRTKRTIAS